MVLQNTGPISFSQIQSEFGGTNPISLSEYYTNANPTYTTGITGIPSLGAQIKASHFYGKAKAITTSGLTIVNSNRTTFDVTTLPVNALLNGNDDDSTFTLTLSGSVASSWIFYMAGTQVTSIGVSSNCSIVFNGANTYSYSSYDRWGYQIRYEMIGNVFRLVCWHGWFYAAGDKADTNLRFEFKFYRDSSYQYIEAKANDSMYFGTGPGSNSFFGLSLPQLTAGTSYVLRSDSSGNNWTLISPAYITGSSSFSIDLSVLNTYHQSNSSSYYTGYITSYYNYTYDMIGSQVVYRGVTIPGGNYGISDGGNDMFDCGNAVTFMPTTTTTAILYGTISNDLTNKTGYWVGNVGYWPHMAATWTGSISRSLTICVSGNTGSDKGGTVSNQNTTYSTASGRFGDIYFSTNYNASDPSIGEVWFTIINTSWNSSVSFTTDGRKTTDNDPTYGDDYSQYITFTGVNFILCKALLSKYPTTNFTASEVVSFVANWVQNIPSNCFNN